MYSTNFKTEITWFGTGCALALMVGAIIGWPASTLTLFLAGYVGWLLHRLETIVGWLRSGGKSNKAPASLGLTDEIIELVHREKKYSRKQKNRFRTSLAQFNTLAASLPDAIVVLDEHHEIRWSNPAAARLLNIRLERDCGQRINNLIRSPVFHEYMDCHEEGSELEIPGTVVDGQTLALRKVPNAKRMMVLIAADITQRVKLREMRKAFIADVSHELRTPLTVIRGYLEMLQEEYDKLDPVVVDALHEVSQQSDRMRGIVEELLELSKLEANPLGENEGDIVSVGVLIRSMMASLKKDAPGHHFELSIDDSLAILGSERELYSACNNLLTNAVKYTSAGTSITVSWSLDEQQMACFRVTDNGPGIDARHLSRLSERFYRVDNARSREEGGTGLGLAIVKHAVQRHGGRLDIQSTLGEGSTFTAVFPIERVQEMPCAVNQ